MLIMHASYLLFFSNIFFFFSDTRKQFSFKLLTFLIHISAKRFKWASEWTVWYQRRFVYRLFVSAMYHQLTVVCSFIFFSALPLRDTFSWRVIKLVVWPVLFPNDLHLKEGKRGKNVILTMNCTILSQIKIIIESAYSFVFSEMKHSTRWIGLLIPHFTFLTIRDINPVTNSYRRTLWSSFNVQSKSKSPSTNQIMK